MGRELVMAELTLPDGLRLLAVEGGITSSAFSPMSWIVRRCASMRCNVIQVAG